MDISSIKAIQISSVGFSTSFRLRDNGMITSINSSFKKDTNGMSLIELATKAKTNGFMVESFCDDELSIMDKVSLLEKSSVW
ncbi:MAG: hypothetical protein RR585_05390 [Coprobacillus sp.]